MRSVLPEIVVDWSDVFEPTDDPSSIAQHLAAGYDEGPLLVIPADSSHGRRRPEGRVFADVMSYEAHLHRYIDEVRSDQTRMSSAPRWTGLVRRKSGDDNSHALAVIYALKTLLAPSSKKRFHSPRSRLRVTQDYMVLKGPYHSDVDLRIENIGDGFLDFRRDFPVLSTSMMCSPDGMLTPLANEDDWGEEAEEDDVWE